MGLRDGPDQALSWPSGTSPGGFPSTPAVRQRRPTATPTVHRRAQARQSRRPCPNPARRCQAGCGSCEPRERAPSKPDTTQDADERAVHQTNVSRLANRAHDEIAFAALGREAREEMCGRVVLALALREAGVPSKGLIEAGLYPPNDQLPPPVMGTSWTSLRTRSAGQIRLDPTRAPVATSGFERIHFHGAPERRSTRRSGAALGVFRTSYGAGLLVALALRAVFERGASALTRGW